MEEQKYISIKNAKEHNLKNITIDIPKNKLVVITGLSGSGKSSLAFDTIYAEGQRRYVESLSAYARQFLGIMKKPDVEHISGLSPAISIEQKSTSSNPRSTVGTITEIYDYLRLLFARIGIAYSPTTGKPITAQTVDQMTEITCNLPQSTKIHILSPIVRKQKGEFKNIVENLKKRGLSRIIVNGKTYKLENFPKLEKNKKHDISVIVDRVVVQDNDDNRLRISQSIELALSLSDGLMQIHDISQDNIITFSSNLSCAESGFNVPKIEPRLFSFNSPIGACTTCNGLGNIVKFSPKLIVTNDELSVLNGAIVPFNYSQSFKQYYQNMFASVISHYGENPQINYRNLSPKLQQILMYGSGEENINIKYLAKSGSILKSNKPFAGIVNILSERANDEKLSNSRRTFLQKFQEKQICTTCAGTRLSPEALSIKIADNNIDDLTNKALHDLSDFFTSLKLNTTQATIGCSILQEIKKRIKFLINVGLDYLTLSREAGTLSGGESQRIRLASQIGSGLTGVLYVLDEPSIGLHQRDNTRLLDTLKSLRNLGNSVIVVEHDEEAIKSADFIIDIGPQAGVNGGQVVAQGSLSDIINAQDSLTGKYLSGKRKIDIPKSRRLGDGRYIQIKKAHANNLKNINVDIPIGTFVCITGVSGGGKSSLIFNTLYNYTKYRLNVLSIDEPFRTYPLHCQSISGLEYFTRFVNIDQSPVGRTPRSNPATYIDLFNLVRDWFAQLPESKARGYKPGRFSFNVPGGRCEHCKGDGLIKVEMHFLPDVYVTCEKCQGQRYNKDTLGIQYKDKSIADILAMTVNEGLDFFKEISTIQMKLQCLFDVGLGYIKIGQPSTTLSGGESQRIKLAKELSKRDNKSTLYILDEPTTGLHFEDIKKLLSILHSLVDNGNTVVIIEHNLDVIKTADYIIDIGPEGGQKGGTIVTQGTPEQIVKQNKGYTAKYLLQYLPIT